MCEKVNEVRSSDYGIAVYRRHGYIGVWIDYVKSLLIVQSSFAKVHCFLIISLYQSSQLASSHLYIDHNSQYVSSRDNTCQLHYGVAQKTTIQLGAGMTSF